jgi:hypothetical protein
VGFEPTETHKTSTVFETVPFVHSGILPSGRLAPAARRPNPQCFLKIVRPDADDSDVADANLFPDEAGFTPRPAWQVIEAARRQYLTGELTLPTKPATRLYLRDGVVYFAERVSDGALPVRLMMEGVINREQMKRGTVIVNGVEHVGRMFEADASIDRASVELCVELFTEDVMTSVSNEQVSSYELTLYRRHPSGIDRWYPQSVPVTGRQPDPIGPRMTHEPAAAPAAAEPAPKPKPKTAAKNKLNAPPITEAVPITPPVTTTVPAVPPPVTTSVPMTPPVTTTVPVVPPPVTTSLPMTPPVTTTVPAVPPPLTTSLPMTPPVTTTVPMTPPPTMSVPIIPPPVTTTVPVTPPATSTVPVTTTTPSAVAMPSPTTQLPVTVTATAAPSDELDAAAIANEVEEAIKRVFAEMGL